MNIRFSGSRSGTAPLTWGQRAIWDTIQKTAPDDHYFNFGRVLKVPRRARPLTVERAVEALGALVERHESLRTRLGAGPSQVLETSGAIAVTLSAGDPDRLLDTLAEKSFDYAGEWPLRVGLVVADETSGGAAGEAPAGRRRDLPATPRGGLSAGPSPTSCSSSA